MDKEPEADCNEKVPPATATNDCTKKPSVSDITVDDEMVAQKQQSKPSSEIYRDHSHIRDDDKDLNELLNKADQEGVKGTDQTFPVKLHQLLTGSEEDGFSHIVSWQPHGRSFIVKKHTDFVEKVLPCCFRQTRFASFQRQLNLYGFRRITQGRDKGGYYHELFLRGRGLLALKMQRTKVKGTGARKAAAPETEPDFWSMPFVFDAKAASKPKPVPAAATAANVVASPVANNMPAAASAMSPSFSPLVETSLRQDIPFPKMPAKQMTPSPAFASKPFPSSLVNSALLGLPAAPGGTAGLPSVSPGSAGQIGGGRLTMPNAAALLGHATLPNLEAHSEARRAIMAQMINTSSRLQSLRDSNRASFLGSTAGSTTSSALAAASSVLDNSSNTKTPGSVNPLLMAGLNPSQLQQGPLHLNSLGMPCTCAVPAF